MAGLFALSVDPSVYKGKFLEDLFLGTFYNQHLGADYCGLSTKNGKEILVQTHRGMVRPSFEGKLDYFSGIATEGIGYCGQDREPLRIDSRFGQWSVCFSGNLINKAELIEELMRLGHSFERRGEEIADIEVIEKLISQGNGIFNGIDKMTRKIRGAYSLLVLTKNGICAAREPQGHWPLVIGEKEGAVAIASESGGFSNLGFKLCRDLKPGEIILLKNGKWETKEIIPSEGVQYCSFCWVYTNFPSAVFEGVPSSLVRKRLGAALARQDIVNGFIPDYVTVVPDSGRFHGIGYYQEFCRHMMAERIGKIPLYDEILLKYPHAGRSFTPREEKARRQEAFVKILSSGEDFSGKIVVVCDDSQVRGTQTQENLVPKLKKLGFKEIHFRFSNPELLSYCPWGKTTRKGELLAVKLPKIEERINFLGVSSIKFNTIEDLVQAIGLPREKLCVDCDLAERS